MRTQWPPTRTVYAHERTAASTAHASPAHQTRTAGTRWRTKFDSRLSMTARFLPGRDDLASSTHSMHLRCTDQLRSRSQPPQRTSGAHLTRGNRGFRSRLRVLGRWKITLLRTCSHVAFSAKLQRATGQRVMHQQESTAVRARTHYSPEMRLQATAGHAGLRHWRCTMAFY